MTDVTIVFIDQEREAYGAKSVATLLPAASSRYEFAVSAWVEWFNTRRVLEALVCLRPAEYEERYHEQAQAA